MRHLLNKVVPFLLLGIACVVLVFGFLIFIHLLLLGLVVGFVFFIISAIIRAFRTPKKPTNKPAPKKTKKSGRVIDADDWKEL